MWAPLLKSLDTRLVQGLCRSIIGTIFQWRFGFWAIANASPHAMSIILWRLLTRRLECEKNDKWVEIWLHVVANYWRSAASLCLRPLVKLAVSWCSIKITSWSAAVNWTKHTKKFAKSINSKLNESRIVVVTKTWRELRFDWTFIVVT